MIREQIAQDIVRVLTEMEILEHAPYVTREPFDPQRLAITQFPAILIQTMNEKKMTETSGAPGVGVRSGTIQYLLRCFVRGTELDRRMNEIATSIEQQLDQDRYRGLPGIVRDSQVKEIILVPRMPPLAQINLTYDVDYYFPRTQL
jgi:hypothetical protein